EIRATKASCCSKPFRYTKTVPSPNGLGRRDHVQDKPDPLFLVGDLSSVWVNAEIYETHLQQVRIGASVIITVAAYPEREFRARLSAINPTVDPTTRTIHVRCSVPNSDDLLKPEMFASIRIGYTVKRKVSTVPSAAVLTQGPDSFVLREESAGRFRL